MPLRSGDFFPGPILIIFLFAALFPFSPSAYALTNINNTKHNLSVTGPGPIKALTESRICVFCHTPHNATPNTPLWNHQMKSQNYTVYTSDSSLPVVPSQPTGPTKLCLSCHDGTVALGAVVNPLPSGSTELNYTLPSSSLSYFGNDLSNHHPVVFYYAEAQQADTTGQLVPSQNLPPSLILGGAGSVHCTTCHDPHDNTYGDFLVMDNRYSALCTSCHQMNGWVGSEHAMSTFSVVGILPRQPKTWPAWPLMNQWGCEVCHTPHLAATPQKLLNFSSSPPPPYTSPFTCTTYSGCHGSDPSTPFHDASLAVSSAGVRASSLPASGTVDISGQIRKKSAHHEQPGTVMLSRHKSAKSSSFSAGDVTCVDCHNPHATNNKKASAPNASGALRNVSGVDINGTDVPSVRYEYEVCFKCHGDYNSDFQYIPRVINTTNTRLAFAQTNPSYHPVITMGKNRNVPSIPSSLEPALSVSSVIYCTDCHRDDTGGSKGPHGSSFAPILRERYETADNSPENYQNYALCYGCHDRNNILNDESFKKKINRTTSTGGGHSGHLAHGAPCSACHDPHGIKDDGLSGDHTYLINFDTRIVSPKPGNLYPIFTKNGTFSGRCTLICHGRLHDDESYPQSSPSSLRKFSPNRGAVNRPLR